MLVSRIFSISHDDFKSWILSTKDHVLQATKRARAMDKADANVYNIEMVGGILTFYHRNPSFNDDFDKR